MVKTNGMRAHRLEKNLKSHLVESHFCSQKDTEDHISPFTEGGREGMQKARLRQVVVLAEQCLPQGQVVQEESGPGGKKTDSGASASMSFGKSYSF